LLASAEAPAGAAPPTSSAAAKPSGSATPAAAASATPQTHPLIGFVTCYRDNKKVLETQPQEVSPLPNTRLVTTPLNFSIDLHQLDPGKYNCQVTVLDPTGAKASFWQTEIMVVQ
jgi:hypothetical protein